MAGSHTTSSVIANIVYLLLRHPRVHARLRRDIDAFYPPQEDAADPKHYNEIPYLDAVMYVSSAIFVIVY